MDMFSVDARGTQRGIDFLAVCAGALDDYLIRNHIAKNSVNVEDAPGVHPEGYANYIHVSCGWDVNDDSFFVALRLDGNTVHYNSSVLLPGLRDAMRKAAAL